MTFVNAPGKNEPDHAYPLRSQMQPDGRAPSELGFGTNAGWGGQRSRMMANEQKRYWFAVAVFRDSRDLAATVGELRGNGLTEDDLLVIAKDDAGEVGKVVDGGKSGPVHMILARPDGAISSDGDGSVSPAIGSLLRGLRESSASSPAAAAPASPKAASPIYGQLLQDVAEGAIVLVASLADAQEQLRGARIFLRGNSECVLTHEIAEGGL